jgi:hypothetical protein
MILDKHFPVTVRLIFKPRLVLMEDDLEKNPWLSLDCYCFFGAEVFADSAEGARFQVNDYRFVFFEAEDSHGTAVNAAV